MIDVSGDCYACAISDMTDNPGVVVEWWT